MFLPIGCVMLEYFTFNYFFQLRNCGGILSICEDSEFFPPYHKKNILQDKTTFRITVVRARSNKVNNCAQILVGDISLRNKKSGKKCENGQIQTS